MVCPGSIKYNDGARYECLRAVGHDGPCALTPCEPPEGETESNGRAGFVLAIGVFIGFCMGLAVGVWS